MRLVLLLAYLGILAAAWADDIPLVHDHLTDAVIVVSAEASPQVRAAAGTLQTYIEKSTGARLPVQSTSDDKVALHVGETDYVRKLSLAHGDLDEDGFILKGEDARNFIIIGGSDWGTEFGVYDFLERFLGVRWLMPTDLGTEIPAHDSLILPHGEVREEPAYLSRQLSPMEIERKEPPKPYAPWRQYQFQDTWGRFNRTRTRVEFHHNLKNLFTPSRFAATHPEFFPMVNGRRLIPKDDKDFRWQPNFSAPGLVEAAVHEIDTYFQTHPNASSFSLGVNDLRFFDESAESKARRSGRKNYLGYEDVSDDYFQWANAVAARVREKYPDKLFGTLAYSSLAEPPEKAGVGAGIVPFLTFERLRWADPELRRQDQALTQRWAQKAPQLGWYDYVYGRNYLIPRVWPHLMDDYLRWGLDHHVRYYVAEVYPNWGEGPKPWILAKLLWNPKQSVDELLTDWYVSAVGEKAAPKLAAYFDLWEKFWTEDLQREFRKDGSEIPAWNRRSGQYLPFEIVTYLLAVPPEYLKESRGLLDEAARLAETPTQKARVGKIREMWDIYESSVIGFQADNLWRTADLSTKAQALALLEKCERSIQDSARRKERLDALKEDDLLGHSVYRISVSENSNGADWGASSLWSLLPWIGRDAEVRARLERLSREGETAESRRIAELVLKAAAGEGEPLLKNPSFEEGMRGWETGSARNSSEVFAAGEQSAMLRGNKSLIQSVPITAGRYYAIVHVYQGEKMASSGKALLTLATINNSGKQGGRELPAVRLPLHEGQWSTFVLPFRIDKEVVRIPGAQLRVGLELSGFGADDPLWFDDVQVYRVE